MGRVGFRKPLPDTVSAFPDPGKIFAARARVGFLPGYTAAMTCFYVPPHLADRVSEVSEELHFTAHQDALFRQEREVKAAVAPKGGVVVSDARSFTRIPGAYPAGGLEEAERVRRAASVVAESMLITDFPDAVIRYGRGYANAFFNGEYLVFGQGDGVVFGDFTLSLDVAVHEMGHQMVARGPALVYQGQSGALNEHLADVFGICAQQYAQGSTVDWRLGQEILLDEGSAIRDMRMPGQAYDNDVLGKDPQPSHMREYVYTRHDNGGVHINSGIPNRAFALFTEVLGVPSWHEPLRLWRHAMLFLGAYSDFEDLARGLLRASAGRWDAELRDVWDQVGISV